MNTTSGEWLLSDIEIYGSREESYTAKHKYQGYLIEGEYYASKADCRDDAEQVLKEKKYDVRIGLADEGDNLHLY